MTFDSIDAGTLQSIVNSSSSIAQVLEKLNYSKCRTAYTKFHTTCSKLGVTYSHFSLGLASNKNRVFGPRVTKEQFISSLFDGAPTPKKDRLVEFGVLESKCYGEHCTITNSWLGKPVSLQLDHINGINTDNRPENLRFLCPNCHSQTETYAGRNNTKPKKFCVDCSVEITRRSNRCSKCSGKRVNSARRKVTVSKNKLELLLSSHTYKNIGDMFGVSDTAIRKLAKKYRISR